MGQRISRAKQQIKAAGGRFLPPTTEEEESRLAAVMHVLYLIFNEGYTASGGAQLHRVNLTTEAIRLTQMLHRLQPDQPEAAGLLALMLLTKARRPARATAAGDVITMSEQDRSRWDPNLIEEGTALITTAMQRQRVGPYQLQAAIAALHDEAPTYDETDWPQIAALYAWLERLDPITPVRLARAVAVAMAYGVQRGLALLNQLPNDPLTRHRHLAVRAHLTELAGDRGEAATLFRKAAALTSNQPEKRYLETRAGRLDAAEQT